ncbi:MAG: MFS transporter [Alphaproteobacteria bacterium]|nr:MFS transporter [Alphaproteobacteria bacterium]
MAAIRRLAGARGRAEPYSRARRQQGIPRRRAQGRGDRSRRMNQTASEEARLPPRDLSMIIGGAMIATFLAALDQTIVATALPSIAGDLGDVALLSWVVTSYLVTSICATAIAGKLSDIHGRRRLMLAALAVFVAASVACALAESMVALIAARAAKGIGGGALVTLAQTVVADVVSPRERGRYSAHFSAMWALASLLGPTVGGGLTQYLGWQWIFWINLPLGLVALATVDSVLRKLPVRSVPARIDAPSLALLPVATTALLLALSWGGVAHPWASAPVLAALAIALAAGAAFWRRQGRLEEPVFAPAFLRDDVVAHVLPAVFLSFGAYLSLAIAMPVFLQVKLGLPPGDVGLMMIPLTFSATVTAYAAGRYLRLAGDYRRPVLVAFPFAALCCFAFAAAIAQAGAWTTGIALACIGFGIGPIFPTAIVAAQNAVAPRDVGAVMGALGYARALGGAVCAAAATALVLALAPQGGELRGLDDLVRAPLGEAGRAAVAEAFRWLLVAVGSLLLAGWAAYARVAARTLRGQSVPGDTRR